MRKIIPFIISAIILCPAASCKKSVQDFSLQKELADYIRTKDANIGIAVIIDRQDTVEVNGEKSFPMLSVYKFLIAVALGERLRNGAGAVTDSITVAQAELKPDTYSPMRERYMNCDSFRITVFDLLAYALQQSDNNASDILLKMTGGTANTDLALKRLGIENIHIASTEDEMHADNRRCYENSATPLAMARFLDAFDHEFNDPYSLKIKDLMETCATGTERLSRPLKGTNSLIGHKTGTGFTLPDGRLMAVNDVGYVHLPSGRSYSIAVFVENSGYDMAATENIIAEISLIVYDYIKDI